MTAESACSTESYITRHSLGTRPSQRKRRGLPEEHNGLTACLDPETGKVNWLTTKYYLTSKCTLSSRDGRIYIGGYNRAKEGTDERFVWCLDAKDGSLVWQSDAVTSALNVVTVGPRFIFSNALRGKGNVFDRTSGKVVSSIGHNYACCRFTLSEPFVLGANMDMIDLSKNGVTCFDGTSDRFTGVSGRSRFEWSDFLHVAGQRICCLADVWRGIKIIAGGLGTPVTRVRDCMGLATADWIALGGYLFGVTLLGIWASRKVKGMADFVMPRRFGKLMMLMHGFGTSTHSDQAVTVASKCYSSGLSGIWYQWMWLFATPFFWLIAPMMRRFRALTTADVFAARYATSVAILFCVFGLAKFVVTIGNMLKGSGAVVEACTGSAISAEAAIVVMTVLFVVYGLAGGLRAAIITDFVQGVLTLLFSFLLLPVVLNAVGGLPGMRIAFADLAPDRDMLSLVTPGDIGIFYIGMIRDQRPAECHRSAS